MVPVRNGVLKAFSALEPVAYIQWLCLLTGCITHLFQVAVQEFYHSSVLQK